MIKTSPTANLHLERCRLVRLMPPGNGKPPSVRGVDPAQEVADGFASPLDFPPLHEAIVPGDHIAIPVDETVSQVEEVVCGVLAALARAGVEQESITIVVADESVQRLLRQRLTDDAAVQIVLHESADQSNLCFFGASRSHEPLVINRAIFEADVVLPIGCARPTSALASRGIFECVFPRFSDDAAIRRHRTPRSLATDSRLRELREQTDEAGWLLGIAMLLQVVPGPQGTVAGIVAGSPSAVNERVDELCRALWARRVAERSSLVIAVMSGESHEQTWDGFARSLATAEQLVEEGGAVAICSGITRRPGRSMQRLAEGDFEAAQDLLRDEDAEDSWPAWQLASALQRGPVYLLSKIGPEAVENLGMAPVADWDELSRLANRHESCIVLDESQHVVIDEVE